MHYSKDKGGKHAELHQDYNNCGIETGGDYSPEQICAALKLIDGQKPEYREPPMLLTQAEVARLLSYNSRKCLFAGDASDTSLEDVARLSGFEWMFAVGFGTVPTCLIGIDGSLGRKSGPHLRSLGLGSFSGS